ncbi:MAG: DUF4340 domain-containing protein [Betaproteobacteria bacterium]|nr:DUF4340 domain-containing protein [Betaproteobacteria bacterium]
MKKSWLLNAVLLVIAAALGWFVYLKPRSDERPSYRLTALQAGAARQIRLERRGIPPIVLEKKEGRWRMTAPFSGDTDPFRVQQLLAVVDAKSAHRFAATDLERFDLDRPQTRLTIDGEGFDFGAVSSVMREQYVLTGGAVYTIEPRYAGAFPTDPAQLLRKQLFAAGEVPVRFEFPDFAVAQGERGWEISPKSHELSQDDFNRWVAMWREAAALRAEPYASAKSMGMIRVDIKSAGKLVFDIVQKEPELVLARLDEQVQYHFFLEVGKRLLAPPGAPDR